MDRRVSLSAGQNTSTDRIASPPPHALERQVHLLQRRHRPLLLIDIAVPRDIDPEVNFVENVYLYNVDDLQSIAKDYMDQRKDEIARCESIIAEKVTALLAHAGTPPTTRNVSSDSSYAR